MQNYAQIGDIGLTHCINYLSLQLFRNPRILQHINYSFLYLIVLVKPELSMHGPILLLLLTINLQTKYNDL